MGKRFSQVGVQLSLWGSSATETISVHDIEQPFQTNRLSEFQLSFPVNTPHFSPKNIHFVKIVLRTDDGLQDAILFVTQSQEGLFHLIFFEKMHPDRLNPRRLEIILNNRGTHYQRVGNQQHWEVDLDRDYDAEEWQDILIRAAREIEEPREKSLLGYLFKLLHNRFPLETF